MNFCVRCVSVVTFNKTKVKCRLYRLVNIMISFVFRVTLLLLKTDNQKKINDQNKKLLCNLYKAVF